MTTLDDSDFTTARGFDRNSDGRPLVAHPDTGKLVAYWGASEWPLDGPYTGDPIYGERGTFVHNLVYWMLGEPVVGLKAERERLDIPTEVAKHIADDWQRLADEHAIVVHHVEHPSVNDQLEIASPIDIVGTVGGQPAIIDIKTAASFAKVSYGHQMVAYHGSVRYSDGVRSEWFDSHPQPNVETLAYLAHFPLSKALKAHAAGDPLPTWTLQPVDVEAAQPWADMLHTLRRARPAVAFPGPADTNATPDVSYAASVESQAMTEVVTPSSPTDGEAATSPSVRTHDLDRFGRPILPPADEGGDADTAAVAVLKARYNKLPGKPDDPNEQADVRTPYGWVNAVAKGAQAAGGSLSLAESQPQTIRRFEAMRGLVLLAEGGFADDHAVRGILRLILGDVADMAAFAVGKLVAALHADQAAQFAELADRVANGAADVKFTDDGRCHWGFAA